VSAARSTTPARRSPASISSRATRGTEVEALQRRLAELGYRPGDTDGRFCALTASAVLAFQEREGLQRDQVVCPEVQARLADPQGAGPRSDVPGLRTEMDLDRQILSAIAADGTVTTINTSTGSGKEFQVAEPGKGIVVAHTPVGEFSIVRVANEDPQAPPGTLHRPMWLTREGGFTIHGNPDVPTFPASHGCAAPPTGTRTSCETPDSASTTRSGSTARTRRLRRTPPAAPEHTERAPHHPVTVGAAAASGRSGPLPSAE